MPESKPTTAPFRTAWALTRPYFASRRAWKAWLLVALIVALVVVGTWLDVALTDWSRSFFNAAQSMDKAKFFHQLYLFPVLVAAIIASGSIKSFATQMLRLRWREWLTGKCLSLWMKDQAYYRLRWTAASTDNPDQRISEDVAAFIDKTVSIALSFLSAVLGLVAFTAVLWRLSGDVEVGHVRVPGFLVWVVLLYSAIGTAITHYVGRALVKLDYEQEKREADFRFSLIRVRENAENVALYGGEKVERRTLDRRFAALVENTLRRIRRRVGVDATTNVINNAATIVPWLVMAPRFFARAMQFGDVAQAGNAFSHVRQNLSVIIDNYADIAAWRATVQRIAGFAAALREIQVPQSSDAPPASIRLTMLAGADPGTVARTLGAAIDVCDAEDHALHVIDVKSHTPKGEPLAPRVSFDVAPRERALLSGPSGCGKTTLLRAIAGIWPHGTGRIERPPVQPLFLSQRPYLPLGSLRDALCYPQLASEVDADRVEAALRDVGLGRLAARIDEVAEWSHILSLGEQQRIAFARVLLNAPKMVVLDEASSALDAAAERSLYELLREKLPDAMVLSVGHRDTLEALHDRKIHFAAAL